METSSCTTDLLCFYSSNRPCAIPKSVSGSGIGKIFRALFQIHHKTIIWCLSIFSGVYLVNGRRCRCCISFLGNFRCTFIQQVRLRLCTSQCDPPHPPSRDITGHLRGIFRYLTGHFATSEVSACQMPRDVPARFTLTGALTILQDRQNCQRMGVVYKLIVHSLGGGWQLWEYW